MGGWRTAGGDRGRAPRRRCRNSSRYGRRRGGRDGVGKKRVAFAAPYPGKIIPIHLAEVGGQLIAQKDAFLAAAKGVSLGIAFQKKVGVGFFGGEGFIMERLEFRGMTRDW